MHHKFIQLKQDTGEDDLKIQMQFKMPETNYIHKAFAKYIFSALMRS